MATLVLSLIGVLGTGLPPAPEPTAPAAVPVHSTPDPFAPFAPVAQPTEEQDDGTFEIGGFMRRSPPPQPDSLDSPRSPEPPPVETHLVWGRHHPVAPWKRKGLAASAVVTGVGVLASFITWPLGQARLDAVDSRVRELKRQGLQISGLSPVACRENRVGPSGSGTVVMDVPLAYRCQSFVRMRRNFGIAVGVTAAGALATVTFAILHAIRREPVPRVEARSDGLAVRF